MVNINTAHVFQGEQGPTGPPGANGAMVSYSFDHLPPRLDHRLSVSVAFCHSNSRLLALLCYQNQSLYPSLRHGEKEVVHAAFWFCYLGGPVRGKFRQATWT